MPRQPPPPPLQATTLSPPRVASASTSSLLRQRKLSMTSNEQMLMYGLYKQATLGDAPKRSFSISPAAMAKLKFWNRVSKTVPDDKLKEALGHMERALTVIKEHSKEVVIAPRSPKSPNRRSFGRSGSTKKNKNSNKQSATTQPSGNHGKQKKKPNGGPEMAPPLTDVKTEETLSPEEMLLLAAAEDDELTIRTLLENERALNVNYQDDLGQTALHIAADKGHEAVVNVLLEQRGQGDLDLDACDHDGISVLQAAVIGGHVPICKTLLENGADPDQPDQDGDTARLCAMDDGSVTLRDLFDATLPKHGLLGGAGEGDEEDPHNLFSGNEEEEDYEDDQESCGSWGTDFTEHVNQGVVDRVPSTFHSRKNHNKQPKYEVRSRVCPNNLEGKQQ